MTITLDLRPDIESRLPAQAQAKGVSIHDYVEQIVEQQAGQVSTTPSPSKRTGRDLIEASAKVRGRSRTKKSMRSSAAAHLPAAQWISRDLYVSVVSFGEWRKGMTMLEPGKRRTELEAWIDDDIARMFAGRILPMTQSIAERWGVLEGRRQRIGRPLQVADAQIAATALEQHPHPSHPQR